MSIIATICARGGSVGLKHKNILDFCGKPLIAHSIEQAKNCPEIDEVYVSTDCKDIAAIAESYGAIVPFMRPEELSTSDAGKIPVLIHCLEYLKEQGKDVEVLVDLQPTSPLRSVEDIRGAIQSLGEDDDLVFSVCEPSHNPYFTLVEVSDDGHVVRSKILEQDIERRQDAPNVLGLNGAVYVWKADVLEKGLWGVRSKVYQMPKERSIDIDDQLDFDIAEFLYKKEH